MGLESAPGLQKRINEGLCGLHCDVLALKLWVWVATGSQTLRLVFGLLLADVGVSFVAMLVLLCRKRGGVSKTSSRP